MVIVLPEAPTLTIPAPDRLNPLPTVIVVDAAPRVLPAMLPVIVEKLVTEGVVAEIVKLPFPAPTLMIPSPEIANTLFIVPLELLVVLPLADREIVLKLVTEGVVAEMVMLPAPIPTLIIPAPETFNRFEKVPELLTVVLPRAVRDTDDV
jgi:hypothetical protein